MSWVKKGLVYCPDGTGGWKDNSFLCPQPFLLDDEVACYPVEIETKYGRYMFYDGNGMGKTGFGYAKHEG